MCAAGKGWHGQGRHVPCWWLPGENREGQASITGNVRVRYRRKPVIQDDWFIMKDWLHVLFYPFGNPAIVPLGQFSRLKVALVADELTRACLLHECRVCDLTPLNYKYLLRLWKPDLLFVESAWHGAGNAWKYRIASYPDHPEHSNRDLRKMVEYARNLGIPCLFWNKEDGVHYARFIDSARLFDHVFTVDEGCLERYRESVPLNVTVNTLMFAVQPAIHRFTGFNFRHYRANFVGSYSHHVHQSRRVWQDMMFAALRDAGLGLTVIDRNSDRRPGNYRYPAIDGMEIRPALPHVKTAQVYKDYLVSLNVNTVQNSGTFYSRRLIEILACGGIAVTNSCKSVERYFRDFCHVIHDAEEAVDLFSRLKEGPSPNDLARAETGARYVLSEHTWTRRLETVVQVVGI